MWLERRVYRGGGRHAAVQQRCRPTCDRPRTRCARELLPRMMTTPLRAARSWLCSDERPPAATRSDEPDTQSHGRWSHRGI